MDFILTQGINILAVVACVAGVVLCIIEMLIPGFGLPGITGIILLVLGVAFWARTWEEAAIIIASIAAVLGCALIIIIKSASRGRLARSKFVLNDSIKDDGGYASFENLGDYVGREGLATTALRPSGIGQFGDERIDVVSDAEFIDENEPIVIIRIEGRKIMVKKSAKS